MNRKRIWLIAALLALAFIWGHSMMSVGTSSGESGWLTGQVVNPILRGLGLREVSNTVVRKWAHVTEFTVLSLLLSFWWDGRPLPVLMTGLIAAFLDETIQIFSGRGSQIQDVWIDLIGVALGTAIGCLTLRLRRRAARRGGQKRRRRGNA